MTTSISVQPSGFSEFTVINSQGCEYKHQISNWQAFFDIFRALVGVETSLNKLERIYNDVYSDQPYKASSAVYELISCVKSKYQQDFRITFNNDEKKLQVCFQGLELVELPCCSFSTDNEIKPSDEIEKKLFPHIENKESYKNYLTLCFANFLYQELLPVLSQLTEVGKTCSVDNVPDAVHNLRQNVIPDYNRKISVLNEVYNWHDEFSGINDLYIDTILDRDLDQLGDWASNIKDTVIEFNSDIYSAIIDDIKDHMLSFKEPATYQFKDPATYQELKENDLSLYNMSSMLKTFEFLESTDDDRDLPFNDAFLLQHFFILDNMEHIENAIHEIKHNPGNVNATSDASTLFRNILLQERNARITSISNILLYKLLPLMVKVSNLEDASGIGKSSESQSGNPEVMEELEATIDEMADDMTDFCFACNELAGEYFISHRVIEENRLCLDKVLALDTDSNSIDKKYKNYKLMCDNIMMMAGNIYGHFIQEIGDYLMMLYGSSTENKQDQLIHLKELLSAFDFLKRQGYYDFTAMDEICVAQDMPLAAIETIHDTILSADVEVRKMAA